MYRIGSTVPFKGKSTSNVFVQRYRAMVYVYVAAVDIEGAFNNL